MRNTEERNAGTTIRKITKSNINHGSFQYGRLVQVGRDFITTATIDGKRHYFLEQRDCLFGTLDQSTTFTSLAELKKSVRG